MFAHSKRLAHSPDTVQHRWKNNTVHWLAVKAFGLDVEKYEFKDRIAKKVFVRFVGRRAGQLRPRLRSHMSWRADS